VADGAEEVEEGCQEDDDVPELCPTPESVKQNAFSAVLSTEGRVVRLCWEDQNLKDPKESAPSQHGVRGER
jgi:hypothetical protein